MKTQKEKVTKKKKASKDYTIKPSLNGMYDDQPLFKDKIDRANQILKTVGLPKFEQRD